MKSAKIEVYDLEKRVSELRAMKFTFDQISRILKVDGYDVSCSAVERYCNKDQSTDGPAVGVDYTDGPGFRQKGKEIDGGYSGGVCGV